MKIVCKVDMKSMAVLFGNMRAVLDKEVQIAADAMYEFGRDVIMLESAVECPRDTWALVNSRYINRPTFFADRVGVKLGYGGSADKKNPKSGQMASEYMVEVHEDLSKIHPVGKAKFFEDPVRKNAMKMPMHIAGRIRERTF